MNLNKILYAVAAAVAGSVMSARPCGAGIPPVWQEDAFRIVKDGRAKVYVAPEKVLWLPRILQKPKKQYGHS